MYESHGPEAGKDQVRPAGQSSGLQAETEALSVEASAQQHLRLGVAPTDAAHIAAALFRRVNVHIRRFRQRQRRPAVARQ